MDKIFEKKSILIFVISAVFIITYIFFLGSYPLLDADETRYVGMAREMMKTNDFMTLYLNGNYFFEKPPLFFWIECISFKLFGASELTARLPIVLLSLMPLGLLFCLCAKAKGLKFAFISSIILMTTLEYAFLTKIAILDSVLASFCVSSVLCYFYTFFTHQKNKKWFWLLVYVFMGLAVLAKGIPGMAVPAGTIIISSVIFKSYKETFKSMLYGLPVFLIIALPWHILMFQTYPDLFYQEYIYKHHILRFLGSDVIHRNEPWYFYIITLIWGLTPYTVMFLGIKNIKSDKIITLNTVAGLWILVFFSLSGTKLITYILPVYPFLAVITAEIWSCYIEKDSKLLKYSILTVYSILVLGVILFPFVSAYLLKEDAGNMYLMQISLAGASFYLIRSIIKNERFNSFVFQAVFTALLIGFVTPLAYRIDYSFGENDLIRFAKFAKQKNYTISTYKTGARYSLLYYSELPKIDFHKNNNINWLNNELNKKNNLLIMRNRDIVHEDVKIKYNGVKYSAVEKK